jgi:hypothetical protein
MPEGLEDTTGELVGWAQGVLPDLTVAARALGDRQTEEGVDIRLVGVAPRPAPRTPSSPLVLSLDYLLTVRAADPIAEQAGILELMLAAMEHEDAEVVTDANPLRLCIDLGLTPGPGFVMRAPLARRRQSVRQVPLVRFPLTIASGELGVLRGLVVGPNDTPVAGAVVSAEGVDRIVRTDALGRFRLQGPVGEGVTVRLNARARGVEIDGQAKAGKPVTLRLPLEI